MSALDLAAIKQNLVRSVSLWVELHTEVTLCNISNLTV